MSYTEKIDVLDLLINVLREHEEKMDTLISRLEALDTPVGTRFTATVVTHGNSLGVNIVKTVRDSMGLMAGDTVEVALRARVKG